MRFLFAILLIVPFLGNAQNTAIPDPNFEQALINFGLDNGPINGSVPTANINTVTYLDVDYSNITDLTGIEDFTSLTDLTCHHNQLTNINISQNVNLEFLSVGYNSLTDLDVTQNFNLQYLYCDVNFLDSINLSHNQQLINLSIKNNQLTSIDVSSNPFLYSLNLFGNQLTSIDVTQNPELHTFECPGNQISSIDVTQNPKLWFFNFAENNLTNIDLSNNFEHLAILHCEENILTSLDLSMDTALISIWCGDNQLTCLNIKNGNNIEKSLYLNTWNNPNLTCIEVDDTAFYNIQGNALTDSTHYFSTNCGNSCSVGIEEENENSINTFPNPTSGNFSVDLGEVKSNVKATLSNSLGQLVFTEQYTSTDLIELTIQAPVGIYFLQIETANESKTIKILKE